MKENFATFAFVGLTLASACNAAPSSFASLDACRLSEASLKNESDELWVAWKVIKNPLSAESERISRRYSEKVSELSRVRDMCFEMQMAAQLTNATRARGSSGSMTDDTAALAGMVSQLAGPTVSPVRAPVGGAVAARNLRKAGETLKSVVGGTSDAVFDAFMTAETGGPTTGGSNRYQAPARTAVFQGASAGEPDQLAAGFAAFDASEARRAEAERVAAADAALRRETALLLARQEREKRDAESRVYAEQAARQRRASNDSFWGTLGAIGLGVISGVAAAKGQYVAPTPTLPTYRAKPVTQTSSPSSDCIAIAQEAAGYLSQQSASGDLCTQNRASLVSLRRYRSQVAACAIPRTIADIDESITSLERDIATRC